MWFEKLTGFKEETPEQVRRNLIVEDEYLISLVNGNKYQYGTLEIPTLKDLKLSAPPREIFKGSLTVSEVVGNVQEFHKEEENQGALFQAASQFNLLEMVGPHISPERGVDIYERDYTQGPACAIACGAGTIYRNYFVKLNNQVGQTSSNQINCLEEIGKALNNEKSFLWEMKNGYALATKDGLLSISQQIKELSKNEYEELKEKLRIGLQWDTEVTISTKKQLVTQAYCSALPIAYSHIESDLWKDFASLILEATYEATFYAALKNFYKTENNKLFLTLVGGGAFGNNLNWIFDAIKHSINKFRNTPLDVKIVTFGNSNSNVRKFVQSIN
jgi:hypothetical protein